MGANSRLSTGKVPWELVAKHVSPPQAGCVELGPALGEDAAVVRFGDELWAVAADPITFTSERAAELAVMVNANDVAATGAAPTLFVATVLVAPAEADEGRVAALLEQLAAACRELGVALIGGHSEVTPGLDRTIVAGTMLGRIGGRVLRSGGLQPGDRIGMTKFAGLEGTEIIIQDFGARLRAPNGAALRPPSAQLSRRWLSIVPEARIAADHPPVTALHDVTEGGVAQALHEMASASGCSVELDQDSVPLLPETRHACRALGLSPLGLLGSGALLIGCDPAGCDDLQRTLADRSISLSWIGRATPTAATVQGVAGKTSQTDPAGQPPRFSRDEIVKLWLLEGAGAVVFDMDGTLFDSPYDWPAFAADLQLASPLLDTLQKLPSQQRQGKLDTLAGYERDITARARPRPGAAELVQFCRRRGLRTALVTNNGEANARQLIGRLGVQFDAVVTRDDGVWKPSPAPLELVAMRLGLPAARCVHVADAPHDFPAARSAGYQAGIAVHAPPEAAALADHALSDLSALRRYIEIVRPEPR